MPDTATSEDFVSAIKELEDEFTHLMGHIRRSFAEAAHRVSPGMLPGSYKVFTTIAAGGEVTASDVAERLMLDKGHLSRTIKELEELGLIVRTPDPRDGRASLLSVTEFGTERLKFARNPGRESLAAALTDFTPDDVRGASRLFRALYQHSESTS